MNDDPLIIDIRSRINEEIERISQIICSGSLNIEEYKKQAGRIQGLNMALSLIEASIKDYIHDE